MKKIIYSLCALCMALALVLIPVSTLDAFAHSTETELEEQKILCTATIEDEFAEDKVLVVLNHKASMELKTYTPSDFPEIDCEEVEDLTDHSSEVLRKWKIDSSVETKGLENKFHQILAIVLKEKTKRNVLGSIKRVEKRADVLSANPDIEVKLSDGEQQFTAQSESYALKENRKSKSTTKIINPGFVPKPIFDPVTTKDAYSSWAMEKIQAPLAWNYTTGSKDVVVGILYDGVNSFQRDLDKKIDMLTSRDYVIHCQGLDIMGARGTNVAGIIGANANNNMDIAGLNWNVTMVSIRITDKVKATAYAFLGGLEYAKTQNIPILNVNYLPASSTVEMAVGNYPGLIVNFASYSDVSGKYNHFDNVITVGALLQEEGKVVADTCEDKTKVSLFAPGSAIPTTGDNGTAFVSEYSICTAFVSGTAALMLAENPTLSASEIKTIITSTVDKAEYLSDLCESGGSLNTYEAVKKAHKIHEYGKGYISRSNTQHASYCGCGESYKLESHWAYASSVRMYNGHQYATCALCKTEIDINENLIITINDNKSMNLDFMGLKVIESPEQLAQSLTQFSEQRAIVLSYYDEKFFEDYFIVMGDKIQADSVVESLYANIINSSERLDKEGNLWYNIGNNCEEARI